MAAARVIQAREAGASIYSEDLFTEAEDALRRASAALSSPKDYRAAIQAASLACIRADEARARASREKDKIYREADRLLRECEALMEESRSIGADELLNEPFESFLLRHGSLLAELEAGRVSESREGAGQLKKELLVFLGSLEH